jgi:hypothetical protein
MNLRTVANGILVSPDVAGVGARIAKNLTTEEVAERFRTSPESVRFWRHTGKGPRSFRVGKRVLYSLEDVEAWERDARESASVA